MNATRLQPAMKYQLYNGIKSMGMFFAVMLTVMLGLTILFSLTFSGDAEVSIGGLGMGGAIMLFVLGLVTVRENLKLFLQNGCGRTTVFATDVLGSIIIALIMALASELLLFLFGLINPATGNWSLLFFGAEYASGRLPLLPSLALRFSGMLLTWRFGMFVSLVYYRLARLGQVAVSIIVPAFLFIGLPVSVDRGLISSEIFERCFQWLIAGPYNAVIAMLLAAIPLTLGGWLLLRKAQVKE